MPTTKHHIEVIARALIRRGPYLLACQSLKGRYFYLPGGHVEFGEPAAHALARELTEETGLRATVGPLLLTTEGRFKARRPHHEINLVFLASLPNRPIRSREPKIAFAWLDLSHLDQEDFRPRSIRSWILRWADDPVGCSTWNSEFQGRAKA